MKSRIPAMVTILITHPIQTNLPIRHGQLAHGGSPMP
jgi:hypothetical protein